MADYCPRLIEVALPIREVSFESARDKSIRHGHISTLHLWWARRPLPASRAIVFASLVPDPDHKDCPVKFKNKVEELLSSDAYKPYVDIPHTTEKDPLPDTLRNRLLMFIGRFSQEYVDHERKGTRAPAPKDTLSAASLIKWESGVDQDIIGLARELLLTAHGGKMPSVLDPFAGGGAIPLEASRMGCETYANELNPVAHIIELCSLTYPRQYGKKIEMPRDEYEKQYGKTSLAQQSLEPTVQIQNKLAHDVEYWANWVLKKTKDEIGNLYPKDDKGRTPVAYIWAKIAECSNPSCKSKLPLLRSLWVVNTKNKHVAVKVDSQGEKDIAYQLVTGNDIDFDPDQDAPNKKRSVTCYHCGQQTSVEQIKNQSVKSHLQEDLIAVVVEGEKGKEYRDPTAQESSLTSGITLDGDLTPTESMADIPDLVSGRGWGIQQYAQLFNPRQLKTIQTFIQYLHEVVPKVNVMDDKDYAKAIAGYLGLWIDRIAVVQTNVGRWHLRRETIEHPFSRQAIAMTWDYPEGNPFSSSTGSAANHIDWITRYIERESIGESVSCILGSATHISSLSDKSLSVVVTDPPYYDAIGYADLSDFFYVWLKRSIGHFYQNVFRTPLTPKDDEATSMKHRHGSSDKAKQHFEKLLCDAFNESRRILADNGVVSIMFAHQSTEAWTAFVKAILEAGLNITASWPIDTEMKNKIGAVAEGGAAYLSSSVTVVCRKRESEGIGSFKNIRKELEKVVEDSLNRFWQYGFRGADLIVSAFGPAVGVFGKYEHVEKADGSRVTVEELLNLVRELAFRNIVGGLKADTLTRAYVGWLNLYGVGEADYDDARQTIQMGTDVNIQDVVSHHIFEKSGNKVRLATLSDRETMVKLGEQKNAPLIDHLHKAMLLWKQEERPELVRYLSESGAANDERFWKLSQALFETLPKGHIDWKNVQALLAEKSTLVAAAKQDHRDKGEQASLI